MRFIDREDVSTLQFGAAYTVNVSRFLTAEHYQRSQAAAVNAARHQRPPSAELTASAAPSLGRF